MFNFKEASLVEDSYLLKQKNYNTANNLKANTESQKSFAEEYAS